MCRLYAFRSTLPRKVECELIAAQNSLLAQSRCDGAGVTHPDGWGLGYFDRGQLTVTRQPSSAFEDATFRWSAAQAFSTNVIAHVRKATVGEVRVENAHPFVFEHWLFAHNGTLRGFPAYRDAMCAAMTPHQRAAIHGDTDSEHLFHFLLSVHERAPELPLLPMMRAAVSQLLQLAAAHAPGEQLALNLLLTNGGETVGLRYGPTLWRVERTAVHPCDVCGGTLHVGETGHHDYRAVVLASERITASEHWREVPDRTLFLIDADTRWHAEKL
jgi:glutamine amidotransferase